MSTAVHSEHNELKLFLSLYDLHLCPHKRVNQMSVCQYEENLMGIRCWFECGSTTAGAVVKYIFHPQRSMTAYTEKNTAQQELLVHFISHLLHFQA